MIRVSFAIAVTAVWLAVAPAHADGVDDIVKSEMKRQHIPGLSLVVVQDGHVVKEGGYGFANVELRVPASKKTVYEIGSITKQFTSTCIMMLVEERKLSLDDPIKKFVSAAPDVWSGITIRHLLTHTSGIKNYTSLPDIQSRWRNPITAPDMVKLISTYPLDFPPGDKWSYSNSGYFLLGMVLEQVTGKPLAQVFRERIFAPLGMNDTRVNDLHDIVPNRATGYSWDGSNIRNCDQTDMTWPFAAGAIMSTVDDMVKWDAAQYSELLLKRSSLQQMWTPVRLNNGTTSDYGFGWQVGHINGHWNVSHGGGIPGFTTEFTRFPDDKLSVVVFVNQSADPARIARRVAGAYLPAVAPPTFHAIRDTDPDLTARTRALFEHLAAGTVDSAAFTADQSAMLSAQIKPIAAALTGFGPLRSIVPLEYKTDGTNHIARYRMMYRNDILMALLTINAAGKISDFAVSPE